MSVIGEGNSLFVVVDNVGMVFLIGMVILLLLHVLKEEDNARLYISAGNNPCSGVALSD